MTPNDRVLVRWLFAQWIFTICWFKPRVYFLMYNISYLSNQNNLNFQIGSFRILSCYSAFQIFKRSIHSYINSPIVITYNLIIYIPNTTEYYWVLIIPHPYYRSFSRTNQLKHIVYGSTARIPNFTILSNMYSSNIINVPVRLWCYLSTCYSRL